MAGKPSALSATAAPALLSNSRRPRPTAERSMIPPVNASDVERASGSRRPVRRAHFDRSYNPNDVSPLSFPNGAAMDLQIHGLRVLVTAGASGIGLATARAFCREGAKVVICD